jgi:hypothetical protein
MTSTDKNLRIWIAGNLVVEESVRDDEIDHGALARHHHEMVMLAAKRDQPYRVELGDRDADVTDTHWPNRAVRNPGSKAG